MKRLLSAALTASLLIVPALDMRAAALINEIMFHPAGTPEDPAQEWIEIYNSDPAAAIDLSNWKLSKGIDFVFPAGATLAPGGYLVVAANVAAFNAAHTGPNAVPNVIGGWVGKLSNSGNTIRLEDSQGVRIQEVSYASEGDWAIRARGPLDLAHRGWIWTNNADGAGNSLELRNPALFAENNGQNWAASIAVGGTPGAANGNTAADIAPLISNIKHRPHIPRSTDPIKISAAITGELNDPVSVSLKWRIDGSASFISVPMTDGNNDGEFDATIPPQANLSIIEFYIQATDTAAHSRTWPAPVRTSNPGVTPETFAQAANALLQVDNTYDPTVAWTPGAQPIYRVVLTTAERTELNQIWTNVGGSDQSDASFNATFLSLDGTGQDTNYLASVRNRGNGSRQGPPNNALFSFPTDALWKGRKDIALNCRYAHSQNLGALLMTRMGVAVQDTAAAQARFNGVNLALASNVMYGTYARVEQLGSDWVKHHFPLDSAGNLYQVRDIQDSGNLRYEGADQAAYTDSYFKQTNSDAADWSDIVRLCDVLNNSPAAGYKAAVSQVIDLDQWLTYLAGNALIGNQEGGISTGRGDDYSLYRGLLDPRFRLVEHDMDTTMSFGGVAAVPNASIFTAYEGLPGLSKLLNDPSILPDYYAKYLELIDRVFNPGTANPLIDQAIGYLAANQPAAVTAAKNFLVNRRAGVLAQIQQNYAMTITTGVADVDGSYNSTDGSATISGTFNVAKTRSILVNGVPATLYYRANGAANPAGTWKVVVAAGSTFFKPGINSVTANFYDGPNGTGAIINSLAATLIYSTAATQTNVAGTLSPPGTLSVTAPANYVPGTPIFVRIDLRNTLGDLDRLAWNRTATLTGSNGIVLNPATVPLYNGVGSALVSVGSSSGGSSQILFSYGTGGTGTAGSGVPGSIWKSKTDMTSATIAAIPATWKDEGFDDSTWVSVATQTGYGDLDENTPFARVDYNTATGTQSGPSVLFRNTFTISDITKLASVTGEIKYDDGAIVYVNGTEVLHTANLPGPSTLTTYADLSGTTENALAALSIPLNLLHDGVNTIAVQVHQHDTGSTDSTFDLKLAANLTSADPGNFTLSASVGSLGAQKPISSLGAQAQTVATGTLPVGATNWSGIVHVTGDVTVPTGAILTIAAGTHVLVDGTATAGDTAGKRIIVNGTLNANGTAAAPISITSADPATRWGQLSFSAAQPSIFNYVFLSHAGHVNGAGHTSRGPAMRMTGSNVTLNDTAIADSPAKAIYTSGTCNLVIERSLITRLITGPELEDGCSLLLEDSNIQLILPDYRESSSNAPDDEDCLYVHNGTGRPITVRRSVFARCGDDAFDCLGGPITVEDSILREAWDKGMSLLNNDLTISRTLIVDCDKAIVPKCNVANGTVTINVDQVTMLSEDHNTTLAPWGYSVPPGNPDPDTASTGLYTQDKNGQSVASAHINITARNSIIEAKEPIKVDPLYPNSGTIVTYSNTFDVDTAGAATWPGPGNVEGAPLLVDELNKNFHLTAASPAHDAGDPASTLDSDGTRADMGALAFGGTDSGASGTVTWSPSGGPYHITADVTVPAGLTLVIQAGTSVQFDQNKRLTVKGTLQVEGTKEAHVTFSHVPGTIAAGDCDPIKNGVQTGPPKWGGIRIVDSLGRENKIAYADFINAQGTSPVSTETQQENWGSIGVIRSWAWIDHCTWSGSHLRWCYGRCAKLTVSHCIFGNMFDATEAPPADFIAGADNSQEPLKVEYISTDAALAGNANFVSGFPVGGWFRVYYNDFYGNKGHNDVFDGDGGRVGTTYPLDCRYNYFHGLSGDEHMDLKGDALIANNIIEHATKDQWTSDNGYSNAISTDNVGAGTTIMVARNLFFDLDHAANLKGDVAAYFEHNTCANFHADFHYVQGAPYNIDQQVKCSVINVFVPEDGGAPPHGDGFYMGYNLISGVPRLVSGADSTKINGTTIVNTITTKIEFNQNIADQVTDLAIGANHPGTIYNSAFGTNIQAAPGFVDATAKNFALKAESAAKGSGPGGLDIGYTISEWVYLLGGPSSLTQNNSASFQVGGPGLIAYKWRLDGGSWSAVLPIGSGAVYPRTGATVRQAVLNLTNLGNGQHTLEVIGQDFAGNWQDADPAKSYDGLPQFAPTTRTWTVNTAGVLVRLNEILADSATAFDTIELYNGGTAAVNIGGYTLSDDPLELSKYTIPAGTMIAAGGYYSVTSAVSGISLDKDGETVYLRNGATLVDSVSFGHQIAELTIGRIGTSGDWALCTPTFGAANVPLQLGDPGAVRISEWFADGEVLYNNDFIELANPGPLPVALAGMRLSDNPIGNPKAHIIAPLSFIAANGYLKFIADGNTSAGPTHLAFSLDPEQEIIALADSKGIQLDILLFGPQTTDYSQGRDAAGLPTYYELPTAGLANGTGDPAYANALALLHGLRITEIMFNPVGGNDFEFIELRNVGAVAFNLNGVKLVNGISFTFPLLTLSPGKNVVLVSNLAQFRSRYGNDPAVAGVYSGKLDNSGEGISLQLPPPFDANILTFTYSDSWQLSTDGYGKSLVVFNPLAPANQWADSDTWAASASVGGDPDGYTIASPDSFGAWMAYYNIAGTTSDGDLDGIPAVIEYALGLDPTNATDADGPSALPFTSLDATRHLVLHFSIPSNAFASQLHGFSDTVYTVQASTTLGNWTTIATKSVNTPWTGTATVTLGSVINNRVPVHVQDAGVAAPRYLRLQVTTTR
ncbi:MAG: hypothetical protein JWL90_816 [Chthoniobacteraceae bacterium]|nr:hypothetical protein [Chthoniobacteraceae bacterium]